MRPMNIQEQDCSVEITLRMIGGKWKIQILWELMQQEPLRHGELSRRIPGVSGKVMVQQLRELEEDGLVRRKVYPEVPPRVEYRLSGLGQSFRPVMESLCRWGDEYRKALAPRPEQQARASHPDSSQTGESRIQREVSPQEN